MCARVSVCIGVCTSLYCVHVCVCDCVHIQYTIAHVHMFTCACKLVVKCTCEHVTVDKNVGNEHVSGIWAEPLCVPSYR
jgi:hypothetical protein